MSDFLIKVTTLNMPNSPPLFTHKDNKYIIKMKDKTSEHAIDEALATIHKEHASNALLYKMHPQVFNGFFATILDLELPTNPLLKTLESLGTIEYIAEDALNKAPVYVPRKVNKDTDVPMWHLVRLSQQAWFNYMGPNSLTTPPPAVAKTEGGKNVDIYFMDSGFDASNPEFFRRPATEPSFSVFDHADGPPLIDFTGHGTWMAAIASGEKSGIAKGATIIPVRTLDKNGHSALSDAIKAVDLVYESIVQRKKPSVINCSGGGPLYPPLDDVFKGLAAFANSIPGCIIVAAAGNAKEDAKNTTPAHLKEVITVAASARVQDELYRYSNFGADVDVWAPGEWICAGDISDHGTSPAAAIVSGLAALYLSNETRLTKDQMLTKLRSKSADVPFGKKQSKLPLLPL